MPRVVFYTATTLDGFLADPDDSLAWLMRQDLDEKGPENYGHFIGGIGALVMGSTTYEWLYATWGLGACLGGLAIGTVFVHADKRLLIRSGFVVFAICLAVFGLAREPIGAFISGAVLGFAYFGTTTSMNTVFQSRLADNERGRVMSLWFMAFGGTVPLGNLVFSPLMDAIATHVAKQSGVLKN